MVMAAVLEAATSAAVIDGHLLAAGHSSDKGRWGTGGTGALAVSNKSQRLFSSASSADVPTSGLCNH